MKTGRITYHHGNMPDGYNVCICVSGDMEVGESRARIPVQPSKFYQHRMKWNIFCDQVKAIVHEQKIEKIVLSFDETFVKFPRVVRFFVETFAIDCYTRQCYTICVHHKGVFNRDMEQIVKFALYITEARLMSMLPGNVATPEMLQRLLHKIFKKVSGASWKIMHKKYLDKHGYNLLTGIGNSSRYPPCMAVVRRNGTKNGKTICIVGKGITFDTGGLAIKPGYAMKDMKYDKIGVIYAAYAIYQLMMDPTLNDHTFIGVFPIAENAVSENALRPGDVVKSFVGKTVEVVNPDAEGRLILADAFGYLHDKNPDVILDIATLTGHAEIVHCDHSGYFYTQQKKWRDAIETGSYELGERMISMPVWDDDVNVLQSEVADLVNTPYSKKCASDSYVATLFLKQFVPEGCDWLHIDLANAVNHNVPSGHGIATLMHAVKTWAATYKK